MSTTMTTNNSEHEDLARWIWTMGIIGFFAIQAVIWLVAITLTWRDPSFAVAANYERDAERWDDLLARRRAGDQLGWSIDFTAISDQPSQSPSLQIRVVDRDGRAVDNAEVELTMFHCARAAEQQSPTVSPCGNGYYSANAHINRNGQWKLCGFVRRGDEVFYFDRKQLLERGGGRP